MRPTFLCVLLLLASIAPASAQFKIYGGVLAPEPSSTGVPYESADLVKRIVTFQRSMAPGSILIKTAERRLYYVTGDGKAISFPVGVGREGFAWSGADVITNKAEWPDWRPPAAMLRREADRGHVLPKLVKGGPGNPLGARALYIGKTEYRIHGTSAPWSVGRASSSGCIRMLNEHVIELYEMAQVGAKVIVE